MTQEYKRCYNCKFFATNDCGYSNWTVTETELHCLKKKFEPIEDSYSWKSINPADDNIFYKQAESCIDYKKETGVQVSLDVDGEVTIDDFKNDEDVYKAAKEYGW